MDQRLKSAKFELKTVYQKLDTILKECCRTTGESLEDREVYRELENLADEINSTIRHIEYYERPVIEGKLQQRSNNDRYNLIDQNGKDRFEFTCGNGIEVYDPESEEWYVGRVEAANDKYYFYNNELNL